MMGFTQTQETYEYLTMTQIHTIIKLNRDSENFETIYVKDEMSKDEFDYKPLLKRIQEYEKQGWEIVSNNVYTAGQGGIPRNYVLMRRKK
jgi:hypothetical protein